MTGRKVTENGNDSAVRWGIEVWDRFYVYANEAEARRDLSLISMNETARLVMDDGNGWAVIE